MSEIAWKAHRAGSVIAQTLVWPDDYWPQLVHGGDESRVFRRHWRSTLAARMIAVGVWTFIGVDRGDIVEVDIDVYAHERDRNQGMIPLAHRSMHKEGIATFDAWQYHPVGPAVSVRQVDLSLVCRVNSKNTIVSDLSERGDNLSARVHYGLQLVGFDD